MCLTLPIEFAQLFTKELMVCFHTRTDRLARAPNLRECVRVTNVFAPMMRQYYYYDTDCAAIGLMMVMTFGKTFT